MIAVGDIHGCLRALRALVGRLQEWPDEKLIFLGDYVDRGPDSKGVLDYLMDLEEERDCVFLRGNHEDMMLRGRTDLEYRHIWEMNGGPSTLASFQEEDSLVFTLDQIPDRYFNWMEKTKLWHETEDYFFVHAGVNKRESIQEQKHNNSKQTFLWTRSHHNGPPIYAEWEKTVVCGHTIQDEPILHDKMICIDTGAFLGHYAGNVGHLTAIRLPERDLVEVRVARRNLRS